MREFREMLKVFLGIVIGISLFTVLPGSQHVDYPPMTQVCDRTEEFRLKIVLDECSRTVMECVWGPEDKEEREP
jgi:hypothetical protein